MRRTVLRNEQCWLLLLSMGDARSKREEKEAKELENGEAGS